MVARIISKHFKHYVKKRQALRVEPLPELKEKMIYKRYRHRQYSVCKGKITCVVCGFQAVHVVYFQMDGVQLVEKYCQPCLDKYVIIS